MKNKHSYQKLWNVENKFTVSPLLFLVTYTTNCREAVLLIAYYLLILANTESRSPYVIFRAHSILGYTTNLVHYVEDAADTTTCRRFRCGLPCPKADAQRNTDRLGLHLDVKFLSKINILNVLMCSPGFCLFFFLLLRRIEKYLFGLGRLNVQQYEFFARPTLH